MALSFSGKKLLFGLLSLAFFMRIFRLPEFTEFLGDQGMDATLIYDSIAQQTIPLVGPLSSQGLHQGPLYLYLMAPSLLLARFDPLGPSVFMTLLGTFGVFLLWYLGKKLFSENVAFFIAILYSFSPIAISQSRTYWNSFLLPLFFLLILLSFQKLRVQKRMRWFFVFGMALGSGVQMHYTGLFFLFLGLFLWATLKPWRFPLHSLVLLMGFFLPLLPFLIYQAQHAFADISGLLLRFLLPGEIVQISPPPSFASLFSTAFQFAMPKVPLAFAGVLGIALIIVPLVLQRNNKFWHIFLSSFLIISLFLASRYSGAFSLHYIDFLFPIPFLLLGSFIALLEHRNIDKKFILVIVAIIGSVNIMYIDTFSPTDNRLQRTRALTNTMVQSAQNQPFAFTLIASPSFSDTHYRYLLKLQNISAKKITTNEYDTLFLICEKSPCQRAETLIDQEIQILCFDLHCDPIYPKMSLKSWEFAEERQAYGGKLFKFERRKS